MFRFLSTYHVSLSDSLPSLAGSNPVPIGESFLAWLIPTVLLTIFLILAYITRNKYNLKYALSELKKKGEETIHVESSSRLIAFISGIIALTASLTITIISMYAYLEEGILPNFENLVNALLALGIGVVPYSINKVAGAFRTK